MTVVVDANILTAFGLSDEPLYTQVNQILSSWGSAGTTLVAPRLFRSKITAVVRKAVYQQRITHEQGRRMLARLLLYPFEFHEDDALLKSAYELGVKLRTSLGIANGQSRPSQMTELTAYG
jgi:predicted nucleic acid-binding protein